MNICVTCQKEYEAKRPTSKYCSDNCRVANFRKEGKKNVITPLQLQVLYNSLITAIENMPNSNKILEPIKIENKPELAKEKFEIKRTPQNWVELRREITEEADYQQWLTDLNNATYLTTLQRNQILKTN